jgi:hypothetical protein
VHRQTVSTPASLVRRQRTMLTAYASLALAEMKMLLREVYSRFKTLPDATMTPQDMEMSDQLISSRPLGQKCLLRFVPLGKSDAV